uniref:CCDC174 alpha/beta GRSR domain-containing protein n=1 Tax=Anopheles atroparvus TaxID=41427 RepID=A0AAG5D4Z4_ANOAO
MNDPNRKIEIDKSSLLSLKAELLRKQEEVGRARVNSSVEDFVPKKAPKPEKNVSEKRAKGTKKPEKKPTPAVTELEDSAQLARSKQMLKAKAKYYERMVASGGALNTDENSLVMFNKKKQDTKTAHYLSDGSEDHGSGSSSTSDSENDAEDYRRVEYADPFKKDLAPKPTENRQLASLAKADDASKDHDGGSSRTSDDESDAEDGEKWVEYTDCLGRTRTCLKKDLAQCLARDRELAESVVPREGQRREDMEGAADVATLPKQCDDKEHYDEQEEIIGPMPSIATSEPEVGERFREMREQWADQEEANLDKDSIHYQDVLFDEARLHGVGYYAFSTDQQERNRQRDELDSIRESTIEAQRERVALRQARDKIIADRVKAARARQRARLGLPPEEEQEKEEAKVAADQLYDTAEERRLKKIEEKQRKKKEKADRRREQERALHVRPWDEGKEHNAVEKEWVPAKERFVLSQHEWNDLKRGERIAEFAPPEFDRSRAMASDRDQGWSQPSGVPPPPKARVEAESSESSEDEETVIGPMPSSKGESMDPTHPIPTPTSLLEDNLLPDEALSTRTLFFTTKKNPPKKELKRRNLNVIETVTPAKQQPVPIRNELSDNDGSDTETRQQEPRGTKGAEIEPPPTYDYYGPSGATAASDAARRKRPATDTKLILEASIEAGLKFLRNQSDKAGGPGTKNRWSSNADY